MFEKEIAFFHLGEDVIQEFRKSEGIIGDDVENPGERSIQHRIWQLFEYPDSSTAASLVSGTGLLRCLGYRNSEQQISPSSEVRPSTRSCVRFP